MFIKINYLIETINNKLLMKGVYSGERTLIFKAENPLRTTLLSPIKSLKAYKR